MRSSLLYSYNDWEWYIFILFLSKLFLRILAEVGVFNYSICTPITVVTVFCTFEDSVQSEMELHKGEYINE